MVYKYGEGKKTAKILAPAVAVGCVWNTGLPLIFVLRKVKGLLGECDCPVFIRTNREWPRLLIARIIHISLISISFVIAICAGDKCHCHMPLSELPMSQVLSTKKAEGSAREDSGKAIKAKRTPCLLVTKSSPPLGGGAQRK